LDNEYYSHVTYQDIIIADLWQRNRDDRKLLWLGVAEPVEVSRVQFNQTLSSPFDLAQTQRIIAVKTLVKCALVDGRLQMAG